MLISFEFRVLLMSVFVAEGFLFQVFFKCFREIDAGLIG